MFDLRCADGGDVGTGAGEGGVESAFSAEVVFSSCAAREGAAFAAVTCYAVVSG